jgi:hypothetical protein
MLVNYCGSQNIEIQKKIFLAINDCLSKRGRIFKRDFLPIKKVEPSLVPISSLAAIAS